MGAAQTTSNATTQKPFSGCVYLHDSFLDLVENDRDLCLRYYTYGSSIKHSALVVEDKISKKCLVIDLNFGFDESEPHAVFTLEDSKIIDDGWVVSIRPGEWRPQ